jgi:diguanylate cyclase
LAHDPDRALATLTALDAAGVRISIDDFGTGYSSMSYLKRLPVSELKVDRSFVAGMLACADDEVLVRSLVELGHNLGLTVVAEGVEDDATLQALEEVGCDVAQGYFLARPMAADALRGWLAAHTARAIPTPRMVATVDPLTGAR